jgi:hypothetical protein
VTSSALEIPELYLYIQNSFLYILVPYLTMNMNTPLFYSLKIQETIEETFRRQSDAIGKKRSMAKATATAFARKYRRTRGRVRTIPPDIAPTGSSEEESGEGNSKETIREQSSADDHSPDLRQKRCRKRSGPQGSPAGTIGSIDYSFEENDELVGGKEILATSPLQGEMLAWGKNGARSQNRHGSVGSNGRTGRSGRIAKLVDYLHTADEMDKDVFFILCVCSFRHSIFSQLHEPKHVFGEQLLEQNSKFWNVNKTSSFMFMSCFDGVACLFLLPLLFKGKSRKGSLVFCHTRRISLLYISSMLQ